VAQDVALSRPKHEFEPRWGHKTNPPKTWRVCDSSITFQQPLIQPVCCLHWLHLQFAPECLFQFLVLPHQPRRGHPGRDKHTWPGSANPPAGCPPAGRASSVHVRNGALPERAAKPGRPESAAAARAAWLSAGANSSARRANDSAWR